MDETYAYVHELLNRQMALQAKIEDSPIAGDIQFEYGHDYYQEETRCMGLRMIRDGLDKEGEKLILDFTTEHYPGNEENEKKWIGKMMRYLNAITPTLIDNLLAEGYTALQSNVELPNENAIFYPIYDLNTDTKRLLFMDSNILIDLKQADAYENLQGWVYYTST
ncbi:hypothetical protein ABE545_18000 [Sphingobacterium faecium]|uniref:hypothetical protein n=1 Tax=Sphingobacterium faecium TaxID=34087 RepID=UPI003208A8D3